MNNEKSIQKILEKLIIIKDQKEEMFLKYTPIKYINYMIDQEYYLGLKLKRLGCSKERIKWYLLLNYSF